MSRRVSPSLTDGELRIMRALWELKRATVADIMTRMEQQGAEVPGYNSVLTLLGILERKRYVRHEKDGRAFLFEPIVERGTARRSALANLLAKFFDGSPSALVLDLLGQGGLDADERARVRQLLDADIRPVPRRKRRR